MRFEIRRRHQQYQIQAAASAVSDTSGRIVIIAGITSSRIFSTM